MRSTKPEHRALIFHAFETKFVRFRDFSFFATAALIVYQGVFLHVSLRLAGVLGYLRGFDMRALLSPLVLFSTCASQSTAVLEGFLSQGRVGVLNLILPAPQLAIVSFRRGRVSGLTVHLAESLDAATQVLQRFSIPAT